VWGGPVLIDERFQLGRCADVSIRRSVARQRAGGVAVKRGLGAEHPSLPVAKRLSTTSGALRQSGARHSAANSGLALRRRSGNAILPLQRKPAETDSDLRRRERFRRRDRSPKPIEADSRGFDVSEIWTWSAGVHQTGNRAYGRCAQSLHGRQGGDGDHATVSIEENYRQRFLRKLAIKLMLVAIESTVAGPAIDARYSRERAGPAGVALASRVDIQKWFQGSRQLRTVGPGPLSDIVRLPPSNRRIFGDARPDDPRHWNLLFRAAEVGRA